MTPEEIQAEIDAAEQTVMPIDDLLPRAKNPRKNTEAAKTLARTVEEVGWGSAPLVQKSTGMVIAGHTRLKAAKQLGLKRLPVRILDVDDRRAKALALADNRVGELAEWDFPGLAEDLSDFGLDEVEKLGFDSKYLEDLADKVDGFGPLDDSGDSYTSKIEAPIYEPKGERPSLGELCQDTKAAELLDRIESSDASEVEKAFLRQAATRHIVFRYDKIAEYYAHASEETQLLMEESALVIIDFNQAIENGFVTMSEQLIDEYGA